MTTHTQIGEGSKVIAEDRLIHLTQRIRQRSITPEERNELAQGFIRLAMAIAKRYSRSAPQKLEELHNVALFGIAWAMDKAPEKLESDDITGWVIVCIRRFCQNFLEMDWSVPVPRRTINRVRSRDQEIWIPTIVVGDMDAEMDILGSVLERRSRSNGTTMLILKEQISLVAKDDCDRDIITLRSEGYTDSEIASKLEVSASYVHKKRQDMCVRFDKLEEN